MCSDCAQVVTRNLERVRRVKTRHQRLLSRVSTVRDELQRFLEDDDDMIKMCLTRKAARVKAQAALAPGPPPALLTSLLVMLHAKHMRCACALTCVQSAGQHE